MKRTFVILTVLLLLVVLFTGCEEQPKTLKVLFANNGSEYSITGLCVKDSNGNWSTSYIPDGEVLYANQYMEFTLPLKKGESAEYKVSIVHEGVTKWYEEAFDKPLEILHWSSPTRYVEIKINTNSPNDPVVNMIGQYDYIWDEFDNFTKVTW